jgi:hypothetical protein
VSPASPSAADAHLLGGRFPSGPEGDDGLHSIGASLKWPLKRASTAEPIGQRVRLASDIITSPRRYRGLAESGCERRVVDEIGS